MKAVGAEGFVEVMLVGALGKIHRGKIHPQLSVLAADRAVGVLENRSRHNGLNIVAEAEDRISASKANPSLLTPTSTSFRGHKC